MFNKYKIMFYCCVSFSSLAQSPIQKPDECKMNSGGARRRLLTSLSPAAHVNFFRRHWDFGINLQRFLNDEATQWTPQPSDWRFPGWTGGPDGLEGDWGGEWGHLDGLHSWENLKPAMEIFSRYGWSGQWDSLKVLQRSTNCQASGETPTSKDGMGVPVESDSWLQTGPVCHPAFHPLPAKITTALSRIKSSPEDTPTFQASQGHVVAPASCGGRVTWSGLDW